MLKRQIQMQSIKERVIVMKPFFHVIWRDTKHRFKQIERRRTRLSANEGKGCGKKMQGPASLAARRRVNLSGPKGCCRIYLCGSSE